MRNERSVNRVRVLAVVAIAAGLAVGWVAVTPAEAEERWRVRVEPMFMIAAGGDESGAVQFDREIPEAETGLGSNEQTIDHGPGIALALEYMATRSLGVEFSAMMGAFDAGYELEIDGVRESWSGEIDFSSVTLGLNYHFTPSGKADWYLGLFVARFEYDDLTIPLPDLRLTGTWVFVGEDGWGYRGGVDVDLGTDGPWFLAVGARHFRGSFDVHPVMLSVGIGRRF